MCLGSHKLLLENLGEHSDQKMNFRMLLCSWWSSSGFIMIFIWVHHLWMNTWIFWACHMLFIWISGQWLKYGLFLIHQKVTFPDFPWDRCMRDKVDSASSCPCFEGLRGPWTVPTPMRVYLWLSKTDLLCFCFSPTVLFIK